MAPLSSKFILETRGNESDDVMGLAKIIQPLLEENDEQRSKDFINDFVELFQGEK